MFIGLHSKNKVNKFNSVHQTISLDVTLDKWYTRQAESAVVLPFGNYYVGTWCLLLGEISGESPKASTATVPK